MLFKTACPQLELNKIFMLLANDAQEQHIRAGEYNNWDQGGSLPANSLCWK
jgi:hypothetical protein